MGFYVVLRGADASYVLVSRDDTVYAHSRGELVRISESGLRGVERVWFEDGDLQKELFPERLKDCFLLFKLDRAHFGDCDVVLGCSEEEKSTVLEILADPVWLDGRRQRQTISSKFIIRKLLAIRFAPPALARQEDAEKKRQAGGLRKITVALSGATVVTVLVAFLWWSGVMTPQPRVAQTDLPPPPVVEEVVDVPDPDPTETKESPVEFAQAVAEERRPVDESAPVEGRGASLSRAWTRAFDQPVTSSPALYEGRVIFGCRDGHVYALDRETGKVAWKFLGSNGMGASPALAHGYVIAADYSGSVYGVDARFGSQIWRRQLPARVVSSPCVVDSSVLVGCYDGHAYCLSTVDGTILWKAKTGGIVRGSASASAGSFLVPSYDGYLYALDVGTGEVRWRYEVKGRIAASPKANDRIVVIGAPDGSVYAIETADGSLRWKYTTSGPVKSSAEIKSGRVFIGSNDRHVYCLNLGDGSLMWKVATGSIVLARPHVRDGLVYAASYDGNMYCLDARTGEVADRFDCEAEIYSSPAVDERAVYFGNNKGQFVCLNYKKRDAL
jgi:outer membrane protein assembly factor BamB